MKKTLKVIFALALTFAMVFSFVACDGNKTEEVSSLKETTITNDNFAAEDKEESTDEKNQTTANLVKAEIEIVDYGTIKLDLYAEDAPKTVANFVNLAKSGFYNGLTFHRIMEDFMMQGGDPLGNGTGGNTDKSGKEINVEGEFSANGHTNNISHIRGTISMARSGSQYESYLSMGYDLPAEAQSDLKRAYNSASSQFFIVHKDSEFLDGNYAAFGRVTDGMDVVDKVCKKAKPTDNNGTIAKKEQPIIKTIKIVE